MASSGPNRDTSSSNLQLIYRKPKKARPCCPSCCSSCCSCCVEVVSGFIFLLAIATVFFLARYFLEFPSIINGYLTSDLTSKNKSILNPANDFIATTTSSAIIESATPTTKATKVSATLATSASALSAISGLRAKIPGNTTTTVSSTSVQLMTTTVAEIMECQLFQGSFEDLKDIYQDQYNDSTSEPFQLKAKDVQRMMQDVFMGSQLNDSFKDSSMFAISRSPFTVYFQLRFCKCTANGASLTHDMVAQALVSGYESSMLQSANLNTSSVIVQDDGTCLSTPRLNDINSEWPWQARVLQNGSQVCTGSLISASWVLSVASCLTPRAPAWYSVELGSSSSATKMAHLVKEIIAHPLYSSSPISHDFAMIHLEKIVWFGSTALPICLPPLDQSVPPVQTRCWAAAWSVTNSGIRIFRGAEGTTTSYTNCTGLSEDQSICWTNSNTEELQIDMGGSFMCSDTTDMPYLTGMSPNLQSPSEKNPIATYAMVSPLRSWIQTYTTI
ncbi:transmembrane protease serine 11D-like isoform X2 [Ambystoma mexicanum]|uniref:transmembrane protease serine 11D-like isoform X2 n=1 Tax=Ambystoma mexicanum TaxID=8296 RepID=UPI0037E89E77